MAADLKPFKAAAFLGSALMFFLELMASKSLLPLFGGGAYVWTTALMFFQGLLFVGYAYGRWAARHRAAHLALLVTAVIVAVVRPSLPAAGGPVLRLCLALAGQTGLPFLVLAATTPVIQEWLRLRADEDPAFLFSYSNAGAFAALLAYPLVLEPKLALPWQARLFGAGLAAYAVLSFLCSGDARRPAEIPAPADGPRSRVALWLLLSLGPNAALLSATNLLSMDLAAVPLVWVMPLAVYLATLILAFRREPWWPERASWLLIGGGLVILAGTAFGLDALRRAPDAWFAQRQFILVSKSLLILAALFAVCLACHLALARSRPAAALLPRFYLWISLGGWLGGLLVAIVVPVLGRSVGSPNVEALAALGCCAAGLLWRDWSAGGWRRWRWAAVLGGLLGCAGYAAEPSSSVLYRMRDFYGFYRVTTANGWRLLFHGRTLHGEQCLQAGWQTVPMAYYYPSSPIGEVFSEFGPQAARVAVVGLGAGTCAALGRAGQQMDFYELDPELEAIARRFFTYLSSSPARVAVIPGDARLSLAKAGQPYDLLVLDAFVGGAIPLHLLTEEAFRVYGSRLAPRGVILVHVTNRFLDLRPVLAATARRLGWAVLAKRSDPAAIKAGQEQVSSCVALAADRGQAARLAARGWKDISSEAAARPWTDSLSSVLSALR